MGVHRTVRTSLNVAVCGCHTSIGAGVQSRNVLLGFWLTFQPVVEEDRNYPVVQALALGKDPPPPHKVIGYPVQS